MTDTRICIERLDQALAVWEEYMWACSVKQKALRARNKRLTGTESDDPTWPPLEGPVVHYKELRRHLLEMESIDDFDFDRFQFIPQAEWNKSTYYVGYFASQLAAWSQASRRVYQVNADLKAILGATSLEGVQFSDVHFPFESFGISLEEPIEGENGLLYDFILLAPVRTKVDGGVGKSLAIRIYNTKIGHERLIPRELIDKMVAREKFEEADRLFVKKATRLKHPDLDTFAALSQATEDISLTEIIGLVKMPQVVQAYRIVFGLLLYLKAMADSRTATTEWRPVQKAKKSPLSLDRRAITDEAEVCFVSSARKLNVEERQALNHFACGKVSDKEMPWHFREGYWRRPPGKGKDPFWPKTVHVEPTVVRIDRKPPEALAGGSLVRLS